MFALTSVILAYATIACSISLLNAAPTTSAVEPTQTHGRYNPGFGAHRVFPQWVTWNTARRNCESQGAHLAIVSSVAEAEAMVRLFERLNIKKGGLHDLYHEEDLVTIRGNSIGETGFNRWQDGEPNDGNHDRNCVVLDDDGKYDDVRCTDRLPYICEVHDVPSEARRIPPDVQQSKIPTSSSETSTEHESITKSTSEYESDDESYYFD